VGIRGGKVTRGPEPSCPRGKRSREHSENNHTASDKKNKAKNRKRLETKEAKLPIGKMKRKKGRVREEQIKRPDTKLGRSIKGKERKKRQIGE